ncbi:MAG TPA: PRC-barrel domain-containing protein, partial [Gemmatimonadaceae bacterium]|nr:PRC-barrel domain-containing protein [Gemmatimonadaceae bacterium]
VRTPSMADHNHSERDERVTLGDTASLKTTASGQLAHLKDLDFKIAEGEPDIRGWDVRGTDGQKIGKVEDLLVDTAAMKVRYIEVHLDKDIAQQIGRSADVSTHNIADTAASRDVASTDDRKSSDRAGRYVLIPIGVARLDDDGDDVLLDAQAAQMIGLPAYDRNTIDRDYESSVVDKFKDGASRAAGAVGLGDGNDRDKRHGDPHAIGMNQLDTGRSTPPHGDATLAGAGSGGIGTSDVMNAARPSDAQTNLNDSFYADRSFDDRSFFGKRRRGSDNDSYFLRADEDERARKRQQEGGLGRDIQMADDDIRDSNRDLNR